MSLFRLLPLTIVFAVALFFLKAVHVVDDSVRLSALIASPAVAKEKKAEPETQEKEPEKGKPAADKGTEKEPEQEPEQETEKESEKPAAHGEKKDKKDVPRGVFGRPDLSKTSERPNNQLGGLRPDDRRFSPLELDLLQQLVKRREQLDKRETDILVRENLLTQTEYRMDAKFAQMEALKTELAKVLTAYNEQEDAKVKGLVKIYESMKPKDAARIFDELEMPILLMVVDKMNEKRVAPVIAGMDSKKAKQLTVELAEMRRIRSERLKEKAALVPPPTAPEDTPVVTPPPPLESPPPAPPAAASEPSPAPAQAVQAEPEAPAPKEAPAAPAEH